MNNHHPPSIIELPPLTPSALSNQPILFDDIETPEIPASLLPGIFGEFARTLAIATETPEGLSVMAILGVLSSCVAKQFFVCPKEGWREPINIYTLIALPPANNKSLVLSLCTKPLVDWEKEQAALLERGIKDQISERKTQEKYIDSLRFKAAKEMDDIARRQLFKDIANLEADLVDVPVLPKLFVNDVTPEALSQCVYEQAGRFAIFSDEGGILETLGGLYNNGHSNIDILLKGIDGGEVRVRRKANSYDFKPYLTLVLAVQPKVLSNLGHNRAYSGNGALERFLYVLPKSKLGYRTHDKAPLTDSLQQAYSGKVRALLNTFATEKTEAPSRLLTLDPAAFKAWHDFQLYIETQLRPDGKLSACLGWGGKICGFALRLAGLLHLAEFSGERLIISEETMQKALTLAALLTEHVIAAYNVIGTDQATEDAKELLRWIKACNRTPITQSEMTLALRNRKVGKAERLHRALKILMDRNIITVQRIPTPKKQTIEYHIHPSIIS